MVDRDRVQGLIRELLEAIGEDPQREGLVDTPRRVADMYVELFEGLEADPGEHLRVTFEAGHDEMVMVRDIPSSPCANTTSFPSPAWLTWPTFRATMVASRDFRNWPDWSRASPDVSKSKNA